MKKIHFQFAIILLFTFIAMNSYSQITYVDLNISETKITNCVTRVETNFKKEKLQVFPNPTKGLFTISMNNFDITGGLKITVHNIEGKVIYSENMELCEPILTKQIDISGNAVGTYFLNISVNNKYYKAEIILR